MAVPCQLSCLDLRPREQGSNWTASGGSFYNGNGAPISNPGAHYSAVARRASAPRGLVGGAARVGRAYAAEAGRG